MGNLMDKVSMDEAIELYGGEVDGDEWSAFQYIVVALDPGGTTGWCVIGVHPEALSGDPDVKILDNVLFWSAGQFTGAEFDQCDDAIALIEAWPSARVVSELFTLRTAVRSADVTSLDRMNAVIGHGIRPRYMILQQPSLAMTTVTDDRQKAMGLWIPGQEHARDATKHALTFLKRQRDRQLKAAAVAHGRLAQR
jgi:hypothetical protein